MKLRCIHKLCYDIRQLLAFCILLILKYLKAKVMGFRKEISSEVPTLVHFFAPWCLPCKTMTTMLHNIRSDTNGLFNLLEIDVDIKKNLRVGIK